MPLEFWDDGDEVDQDRGLKSGDVRGEKALEELELDDEDVEMEKSVYGMKNVLARVWRKLENIGLIMQTKRQQLQKAKELDDGHDGDL